MTRHPLRLSLLLTLLATTGATAQENAKLLQELDNAYTESVISRIKNPYGMVKKQHDRYDCATSVRYHSIDTSYECKATFYMDSRAGLHSTIIMPSPEAYADWQASARADAAAEKAIKPHLARAKYNDDYQGMDSLRTRDLLAAEAARHFAVGAALHIDPFRLADADQGGNTTGRAAATKVYAEARAAVAATPVELPEADVTFEAHRTPYPSLRPDWAKLYTALKNPAIASVTVGEADKPLVTLIGDVTTDRTQIALIQHLPLVRAGAIRLRVVPFVVSVAGRPANAALLDAADPLAALSSAAAGKTSTIAKAGPGSERALTALAESEAVLLGAAVKAAPLFLYAPTVAGTPPTFSPGLGAMPRLMSDLKVIGIDKLPTWRADETARLKQLRWLQ